MQLLPKNNRRLTLNAKLFQSHWSDLKVIQQKIRQEVALA